MANKYDVCMWYTTTEYGKAYFTVEADSEEEAIDAVLEGEVEPDDLNCKGTCEFTLDNETATAKKVGVTDG